MLKTLFQQLSPWIFKQYFIILLGESVLKRVCTTREINTFIKPEEHLYGTKAGKDKDIVDLCDKSLVELIDFLIEIHFFDPCVTEFFSWNSSLWNGCL